MSLLEKEELTATQRKILRDLQRFIDDRGYPPTVEELTARTRMTKAVIHGCFEKLIQKGYLRKAPGKARGIEIVRQQQTAVIDVVAVRLLGDVPAGVPISADEIYSGNVYVPSSVVGKDECFALKVCGNSMHGADICDGDIVIVRNQPLAEHGDIVVASVDGEVTVKRLAIKDGKIRLLPENTQFAPIEIGARTELRVLGKVIATRRLVDPRVSESHDDQ